MSRATVGCPHCGARLHMQAGMEGHRARCRACGRSMRLPGTKAPPPAGALTVPCPGCGRDVPLEGPRDLTARIECARCGTHFVPGDPGQAPSAPPPGVPAGPVNLNVPVAAPTVRFGCPTCKAVMDAPAQNAGQKLNCPECGQRLLIPTPFRVHDQTVLGQLMPDSAPRPAPLQPPSGLVTGLEQLGRSILGPLPTTGEDPSVSEPMSTAASTPRRHSGLGIASFLIALLVGGLDVILAVIIAVGIARSVRHRGDLEDFKANVLGGGMAMVCLNCMSIPLCLVGVGLALVGLIAHRGQNHLFTWIGLLGNGVVILGVVGLYLFGALMDAARPAEMHQRGFPPPPGQPRFGSGLTVPFVTSTRAPERYRLRPEPAAAVLDSVLADSRGAAPRELRAAPGLEDALIAAGALFRRPAVIAHGVGLRRATGRELSTDTPYPPGHPAAHDNLDVIDKRERGQARDRPLHAGLR